MTNVVAIRDLASTTSMNTAGITQTVTGGVFISPNSVPFVTPQTTGGSSNPSAVYPYPGQIYPGVQYPPTITGISTYPFNPPEPKMDISIYRDLEKVRTELRKTDPKALWVVADYHIENEAISSIRIDLELEFWKQSLCEGEVIVKEGQIWFSNTSDAKRFQDEFLPSIIDRFEITDFEEPWDDIREFLNYHRVGGAVTIQAVVTVNNEDFFEGITLTKEGLKVWFMLRAGCIGRVFYFASESTFAFENAGDAILLAAYLTEAEKTYGVELEEKKPKKSRKKRKTRTEEAIDMIEILKQQELEWDKLFPQRDRWAPTWTDDSYVSPPRILPMTPSQDTWYPNSVEVPDLKRWVREYKSPSDLKVRRGAAKASLERGLYASSASIKVED